MVNDTNADDKIVSLHFDNEQFENGVKTTLLTLDKLKDALLFKKVDSGFSDVSRVIKKIDFFPIQNSLENIEKMFSPMGMAFAKVWTDAIGKVEQKISAFNNAVFKEPIKDGFNEYEQKMDSVQTIMNSSGESLEVVNRYLEELNVYADKTIYNFKDMTSSIGKFTNAGVNLKDAVASIQGVSNLAANSGAGTAEASRAMYNFAQALSSGAVKLIDWKSIENANMATVEFKNELIKTALAVGTLVEAEDGLYRSTTTDNNGRVSESFNATIRFNDALSAQWMTTEVLTKTLSRYADETTEIGKKAFAAAQDVKTWTQLIDTLKEAIGSGWAQSFEIIIGNYEEAKELFTLLSNAASNVIDKVTKARNGMLQLWRDNGGREKLINDLKSIINNFNRLFDIFSKRIVGDKYREFFEGISSTTDSISSLSKTELQAITDIWLKGDYGVGEERRKNLEAEGIAYEKIQGYLNRIANGSLRISDITAEQEQTLSTAVDAISDINTEANTLDGVIDHVAITLGTVITSARITFTSIKNAIGYIHNGFKEIGRYDSVSNLLLHISQPINEMGAAFEKLTNNEAKFTSTGRIIGEIFNNVLSLISTFSLDLSSVIKQFGDFAGKQGGGIIENIAGTFLDITTIIGNIVKVFGMFGKNFLNSFFGNINFVSITKTIRTFFDKLAESSSNVTSSILKRSPKIQKIFNDTFNVLNKIFEKISGIFKRVLENRSIFETLLNDVKNNLSFITETDWEKSNIYKFFIGIKNEITNIIAYLKKLVDVFKSTFTTKNTDGAGKIKSSFDGIGSVIKTINIDILEKFLKILQELSKLKINTNSIENVVGKIKSVLVTEDDENSPNIADAFSKAITSIKNEAIKLLPFLYGWGKSLGTFLIAGIESTDWTKLVKFINTILVGVVLWKIGKSIDSFREMLKSLTGITNQIKTAIGSVVDAAKTFISSTALGNFAIIIASLTASLIALSMVPTDKLIIATLALGILLKLIKPILEFIEKSFKVEKKAVNLAEVSKDFYNKVAMVGIFAGISMLLSAISLLAASFSLGDITKIAIGFKYLVPVLAIIASVVITVTGLVMLFTKGNGESQQKSLQGISNFVKSFGVFLISLSAALEILSIKPPSSDAVNALLLLSVTFSSVLVLLTILSKIDKNSTRTIPETLPATLKSLAACMRIVLLPLFSILTAMKIFGEKQVTKTIVWMSGLLGVLALTSILLERFGKTYTTSKNGKSFNGVSILAKNLITLATSIGILTASLVALTKSNALNDILNFFNDVKKSDTSMMINLAGTIFGIIGVISIVLASKMPFINSLLVSVSSSLALVSASILMFVKAFSLMPQAADGFELFCERLQKYGPTLLRTILTVGNVAMIGLGTIFKNTKIGLIVGVISLIASVGEAIEGRTDEIVSFFTRWFTNIVSVLAGVTDVIVTDIMDLITLGVAQLALYINENRKPLVDILSIALDTVFDMLYSVFQKKFSGFEIRVQELFTDMFTWISNKFGDMATVISGKDSKLASVFYGYSAIASSMAEAHEAAITDIEGWEERAEKRAEERNEKLIAATELLKKRRKETEERSKQIFDLAGDIGNDEENLAQQALKTLDTSSILEKLFGTGLPAGAVKGSDAAVGALKNYINQLSGLNNITDIDIISGLEGYDFSSFDEIGTEAAIIQTNSYIEGYTDNIDEMYNANLDSINGVNDIWADNDWYGTGEDSAYNIGYGIESGQEEVEYAAITLSQAIDGVLQTNLVSQGYDTGYSYADQIITGIKARLNEAGYLFNDVDFGLNDSIINTDYSALKTTNGTNKTLDAISKSLVNLSSDNETRIGLSTDEQSNNTNAIIQSIKQKLDSQYNNAIALVNRANEAKETALANEQREYLDLLEYINPDYAENHKMSIKGLNGYTEDYIRTMRTQGVKEAMNSTHLPYSWLNDNYVKEAMENLNITIYLDSGELVGGTANKMNKALGNTSRRSSSGSSIVRVR